MRYRSTLAIGVLTVGAAVFGWAPAPTGAQAPAAGDHAAHLKAWDTHEAVDVSQIKER